MSLRIIKGGCHCGNVHYKLAWPSNAFPITLRECSCSYCQKHGATYTSHPKSSLTVNVDYPDKLTRYRFGHETADFMLCASCGILLFAICPLDGNDYTVINANNFENVSEKELIHSVTNFDQESIDVRLARRKQNWTPDIEFILANSTT